jgi:fructokinase
MYKIGIDLGGTKIEIVVLDAANVVIMRERTTTDQEQGYSAILNRIAILYQQALERIGCQPHTLGIGIPGTISNLTKLVKNANTVCLNGKPLQQDLEAKLEHPVAIQNDANCFTLAEALLGAGVGQEIVFGVIMGTGCGGGITIHGKVHAGIQGIAGEWGHMQIDPSGPDCYCGKKGCVETLISGGGLQRIFQQRYGQKRTVQEIAAGFRDGEPDAVAVFTEFLEHFGIALANVIDLLDPNLVVLGGGLSNLPELYTLGREQVRRQIFSDSLATPIVPNQLGDSAGVFGAAMIGV